MWLDVTRALGWALVAALLAVVLLEAWIAAELGAAADEAVRALRNVDYVTLAALTVAYAVKTGRVRSFLTSADLALVVLAASLVVAGLLGGSGVVLTAEGAFVYLRGVVVFYAIRALQPGWSGTARLLWLLGAIIVMNAIVAAIQTFAGPPAYQVFGFTDLTWAAINRAQGLQSHPNHLGHVVGLASLVLVAAMTAMPRVRLGWWLLFALLAFTLAASQSRESVLGIGLGMLAIAVFRRSAIRRVVAAGFVIVVFVGVVWLGHPANISELSRRFEGVISAIKVPSGQEAGVTCQPLVQDCTVAGLPSREIRVLYLQQGLTLLAKQPLFGYGVGQFGGSVAYENDPNWYRNPRFGPNGFDMHGFGAKQVDSFWLHLLVETGAVGSLAYLAWLALIAWPLERTSWARRRAPAAAAVPRLWLALPPAALAALAFAAVIAAFSPALEDPLFPPLLFAVLGWAWMVNDPKGPASAPLAVAGDG